MAEAGIPSTCKLVLSNEASTQSQQQESWLHALLIYFEAANITAGKREEGVYIVPLWGDGKGH